MSEQDKAMQETLKQKLQGLVGADAVITCSTGKVQLSQDK